MKYWRQNLILFLMFLLGAVTIYRLVIIQVINHQYWLALAQGQQKIIREGKGERGEIFFQGNIPLAVNQEFHFVYISPAQIKDPQKVSEALAKSLNLEKEIILKKIEEGGYYKLIKKRLSPEELEKLKKISSLEGIYLGTQKERFYPLNELSANVVGFVGAGGKGQYGLERYYDGILQGKEGVLEKRKGPGGYLIDNFFKWTEKGADLVLTLDYNIQFFAEKLLKERQENLKFESAQIVVLDPNTGKILALASWPSFNPNQYSSYADNLGIFKNKVTEALFEPGSIFKPITFAAALDQGKITPQTTYQDEGKVKIGGWVIYNYNNRVWGKQSMINVLEKSINTGAVFVEKKLGHSFFLYYIERFGFFEPTKIDLPEIYSKNPELRKGKEINFATASFGQGIEMTPIQLLRAYSAIANGGRLVRPYLVEKIIKNGKTKEIEPELSEPVISQKTATQLTSMLISVVENGFAKGAKIPGYYVAGKTGTAQIPFSSLGIERAGYSEKTVQSFIGFAPAFNPRFLIMVKLDAPQTKDASVSAVPIFRELARYIINLWQIPPDYDENHPPDLILSSDI